MSRNRDFFKDFIVHCQQSPPLFSISEETQLRHAGLVTEWLSEMEQLHDRFSVQAEGREQLLTAAFQSTKSLFQKGDAISAWLGQAHLAEVACSFFPGDTAAYHYSVAARFSVYMNFLDDADHFLSLMKPHFSERHHAIAHIYWELKGLIFCHGKQWRESMTNMLKSLDHIQLAGDRELERWSFGSKGSLLANRLNQLADSWINLGWESRPGIRPEYGRKAANFLDQARKMPHNDVEQFMIDINRIRILLLDGRLQEARSRINILISNQKLSTPKVATVFPLLYCLLGQLAFLEDDLEVMIAHLSTALAESHLCHHALQEYQIVDFSLDLLREKRVDRKQIEPVFKAMIIMLEAKDWYTGHGHSHAVADLTLGLWRSWQTRADQPKVGDDFYWAAYLHDIGKLYLPRSLLSKIAPLTPREFEILRRHPTISCEILEAFGVHSIAQMAAEHHQDAAGSGYPGNEPASAMGLCIGVADILEAATSPGRLYRQPKSLETVIRELEQLGEDRYPTALLEAARQQKIRRESDRLLDDTQV